MRAIIRLFIMSLPALAMVLHAGEYVVVANPGLPVAEISAEDLRLVYLGSKSALGGVAVEPVLAQNGTAHEAFLKSCVGKSDSALRNHLKSLVFTGKGSMPRNFTSDAEILAYVAKTKGAIGYVAAAGAGVKKLELK